MQATNIGTALAFDRFDTGLGTLQAVTLFFSGSLTHEWYVKSTGKLLSSLRIALTGAASAGDVVATDRSYALTAQVDPLNIAEVNFAHPNLTPNILAGEAVGSVLRAFSGSASLTDPLALSAYAGAGSFLLPFSVNATSSTSGGNFFAAIRTYAGADVTLTYDYAPAPLPAALSLLQAGLGLFGFAARRRATAA